MIGNRLVCLFSTAILLTLNGCHSIHAQQSVEALLISSSPSTREVLEQKIGDFFNSQPVKLADNVFTVSSTVLIESTNNSGARISNKRGLGQVDSFTLLLQDEQCMLRHDQSKHLLKLSNISCKAG